MNKPLEQKQIPARCTHGANAQGVGVRTHMPANEDNSLTQGMGGRGSLGWGVGGGAWVGKKRLLCEGMYRVPAGYLAQSVAGRGRSSTPTPSLSLKNLITQVSLCKFMLISF